MQNDTLCYGQRLIYIPVQYVEQTASLHAGKEDEQVLIQTITLTKNSLMELI